MSKNSNKTPSKSNKKSSSVPKTTNKTKAKKPAVNPISQFTMNVDELRLALVSHQYALRESRRSDDDSQQPTGLLVLVNGVELAGKGEAVTQLRQWVDPRLLKVEATIGHPCAASQPFWQSHTQHLPRHGDVAVYFGNWYADLLYTVMQMLYAQSYSAESNRDAKIDADPHVTHYCGDPESIQPLPKQAWRDYFQQQLARLSAFEKDLMNNDTQLLKCWFHIDKKTLKKRLQDKVSDPTHLYQMDWADDSVLAQFNQVATELLTQQDDWVIIDGGDRDHATKEFCHHVLHAMQAALAHSRQAALDKPKSHAGSFEWADIPDKLIEIEDPDMGKSDYRSQLADKQIQLTHLLRERGARHVVFAFEGMDAAGKGGAIKRLVAPLDPREYQIYNIGAPMQYELEHPYLWRFWTRLPMADDCRLSRIAIFDRTWYGRVLVERVESLVADAVWQRAYDEINRFEADLVDSGTIVLKYWLAIDKAEQLERFEDRRDTPHKHYKLTEEDWRNRDKWQDYVQAASDMLQRTNTSHAPWCMVATNDKRTARLLVLDHAINQLSRALAG